MLGGIDVTAGIDIDPACKFPYEANNHAKFIQQDITELEPVKLRELFGDAEVKVLAGCAPCQPFSLYASRYRQRANDPRRELLHTFALLVNKTNPDIVVVENVPDIAKRDVFRDFVNSLAKQNYRVWFGVVNSSSYGVPQFRRRVVLLASRHGDIKIIDPTHREPRTVRQSISHLPGLSSGESDSVDKLHACSKLSEINLQRIRASKPGGTWRDWPKHLVAACHRANSGHTYPSVYGRMEWDQPAPTMTTQCYGFGNGRFGHPEQDRAISLREAAILQSFPRDYAFVPQNGRVSFRELGRLIGNAVPVELGRAIAHSINRHLISLRN